ncbi:uncharacterized protein LOC122647366 [Telopea speciosissima]|uniref:uncharacterized protein LOC122647366 n=1 Tax=Telopea speciosissima TaxID=54955 RepID=UPI001CC727A8|nr:uncharacterized protein LOC122647366 [Telopea speciosissima]
MAEFGSFGTHPKFPSPFLPPLPSFCTLPSRTSKAFSPFYFTVAYAHNCPVLRSSLWTDLRSIAHLTVNHPWGLGGDFNVIWYSIEKQGGDHVDSDAMDSFSECIEDIGANDLSWTGFPLTWSNKRAGPNRIACKLDRVLVNEEWLTSFPSSHAYFDNPGISDHSPISLTIKPFSSFGPKPFKYFNMWSSHFTFKPLVLEAWNKPVFSFSNPLLAFSKRLKNVKAALKAWNLNTFGNINLQVANCKDRLASIQLRLHSDLHNGSLAVEEKEISSELASVLAREESFMKQKSRIKWLDLGDSNTAYFHRSVKARANANSISQLYLPDGSLVTRVNGIKDLAVQHFKDLFSSHQVDHSPIPDHLLNKFVDPELHASLCAIPKEEEM